MAKVFIDAGHGGHDGGAASGKLKEADLTLKIAKAVRRRLNKEKGITVKMSRTTDVFLSLTERANLANNWGADIFISVHINSGGGTGFESFVYNGGISSDTKRLQSDVHSAIMKRIDVRDRGKKSANFAVVRQTSMPAILTEHLFVDGDSSALSKSKTIEDLAQGHVDGILKYLGKKGGSSSSNSKPSKPSKPAKKPSKSISKMADEVIAGKHGSGHANRRKSLGISQSQYDKVRKEVNNRTGGKSSSKPSKSKTKANLIVDGKWGKGVTRALQKSLGTPVDGIISKQPRNSVSQSLYGGTVKYGSGGSNVIVALQKKIGVGADGKLGPATVRALQRHLGTPVDGVLSRPSAVVKELQRKLNNGTF